MVHIIIVIIMVQLYLTIQINKKLFLTAINQFISNTEKFFKHIFNIT